MKILVTGANRGLGLALAKNGAERGHQILAGVRDAASAAKNFESSNSIIPVPLDVTNETSVEHAAELVKERYGRIDAIINNAGILLGREKLITELDMGEMQKTFDVNLFGPMRVVKYFLPLVAAGSQSSIINISSEAGSIENAYGGDYAYASSKTALNMYTEQLKSYVKKDGIRVYAIHPGWIQTDMGGENAPGNPDESANGILDILEGKKSVDSRFAFINFQGESMPI